MNYQLRRGMQAVLTAACVFASQTCRSSGAQAQDAPTGVQATEDESSVSFVFSEDDLSLIDLLELEVVSASDASESVARAPAVIDVITSEELTRFGYRTLAEALESVAGLHLVHDHAKYSLGVRGISSGPRGWSRIVKVMIDGQPISFRPTGENFLDVSAVPLSVVERVEVIRGPGSVLYGADAYLGVVNVITKQAYQLQGGSVAGGTLLSRNEVKPWGEVAVGWDTEHVSLLVGAIAESLRREGYGASALPGRSPPSAELSQGQERLSGSAYGRLTWFLGPDHKLSLDGHFQRLDRDAEFMDWGPLAHGNRVQLDNGYVRARYDGSWRQRLFWYVSGAYARAGIGADDRLQRSASLDTHIEREMQTVGYDTQVGLRYHFTEHSQFSVGLDSSIDEQSLLAHYTVTDDGRRTLNPPASTQVGERLFLGIGAFANATYYPFERSEFGALSPLGLTAGVRLDSQNIYGENFSSRGGLVYEIFKGHYIKLLYGSSYRAPAASQLYSNYIEPGGIIGNPDLSTEKAHTTEAALGMTLMPGMTLRINAYYTRVVDRVEIRRPSPTTLNTNAQPVNSTPIDSFGGEAEFDYRVSNLHFFGSYALQESTFETIDFFSIDRERVMVDSGGYPTHLLKWGASFDLPSAYARFSTRGRWVGAQPGHLENNISVNRANAFVDRYEIDPYVVMDLGVSTLGLRLLPGRDTVISGQVRNLLDSDYSFPGYGGFDIPGFVRSYELAITQEF